MNSLRKIRYFSRGNPVLGDGFRVVLDMAERFDRPMGFTLTEFCLVRLDVEEVAAAEVLPLDVADYLARVLSKQRHRDQHGTRYDEYAVAEVIRLLRLSIPKPLAPVRIRTRPSRVTASLASPVNQPKENADAPAYA